MAIRTPYKHTSRSYYDIYNALKQAYPKYPDWLFVIIAGFFDFISNLINNIAQDISYPFTRESAYAFADLNDYAPVEADGATVDATVTLSSVIEKTIAEGYQFSGVSSSTNELIIYEVQADCYSITLLLALANALKVTMNAHAADATQHATAIDNVNFPVSTSDATNLTTLKALIGDLLTAYAAHDVDAELGSGWAFHVAQRTTEASLASAAAPTTYAECVTRLVDLLAKYNIHDNDATAHGAIGSHQESTSTVDGKTITASCQQYKTVSNVAIGTVTTDDDWLEFPIDGYTKIVKTSMSLTVGGVAWTRVDNFDDSISTDKHYELFYQSNGKTRIRFGDGTTGLKPSINDEIVGEFAVTLGLSGKLDAGELNVNEGGDSDIASVTNASDSSGGNNAESITSIIRNSRANVRTRNIVWSKEDIEIAAKAASSSVVKALGVPGLGYAYVHVIPSGGGNPSAALKATVEAAVEAKTQFELMPVTASDPTYSSQAITADITVRDGFDSGTVADLVEFALTLASSAIDNQVIEYYLENGIDLTRTDIINEIWSWAFPSSYGDLDVNEALEFIINQWIELLGDRDYREWGQELEVGNLWILGDSLYEYGTDTFSLTSPTSNVSCASTTIIDNTSSTVSVT